MRLKCDVGVLVKGPVANKDLVEFGSFHTAFTLKDRSSPSPYLLNDICKERLRRSVLSLYDEEKLKQTTSDVNSPFV